MLIDAFIDFTGVGPDFDVEAAVARLDDAECLGSIAARVTCVTASEAAGRVQPPRGWDVRTSSAVDACRDAFAAAAEADRPLLLLIGDIQPNSAAVGLLLEAMATDPMIGFASARLTGAHDGSVARLDATGDGAIDELPRRLLAELPETYLVADGPARCLAVKPIVLANFGELDVRFETVAGALWHYMSRARRCGFRTLVCNRAIVTSRSDSRPCPASIITPRSLSEADRVLLRDLSPDVERTAGEFGTRGAAASETRLARAVPHAYGTRPSLLLDLRNMIAGVNGTTTVALGISRGLHALRAGWDVTLVASKDACKFHDLEQSFAGSQVVTRIPARQFTAALRLSQPWNVQEMIDLHAAAAYNAYLLLDTIAWDVTYPAPRHLDGTWRFMTDHADALLFISAYTRDRFRRRFQVPDGTPELVTYLAFDPAEYVRSDVRVPANQESFILVVGNDYDHKDVVPTMELLATAFPYQSIVALGPPRTITPRVRVLQSGTLSETDIHRLYAGARVVVFPSFYEGFGFPIVTTLAYGGTLVARGSSLLDELAARCLPRGRIVPFARRDDLIDVVGRLLHDEDVASLPLGTALDGGRPMSWQDVSARILAFLDRLISDLSRSRWRSREHTIAQLMAAPTSLVDGAVKLPRVHADLPST